MKFIPSVDADFTPAPTHKFSLEISKKYLLKKRVLDIGCWNGDFESLIKFNSDLIGLDPDADALKVARKRVPQFRYIKGDVLKELPFSKEFDTVITWMTMEHISSQQEALININKVMKKNGTIFISTPALTLRSVLFDLPYVILGHRHFSKKEFGEYLSKTGFKVEEMKILGGYFVAIRITLLLFYKYFLRKPLPPIKFIEDKQMNEYRSGKGFNELFIRAKKIKDV